MPTVNARVHIGKSASAPLERDKFATTTTISSTADEFFPLPPAPYSDRPSITDSEYVLNRLIGIAQDTHGAEVWRALFAEWRQVVIKEKERLRATEGK